MVMSKLGNIEGSGLWSARQGGQNTNPPDTDRAGLYPNIKLTGEGMSTAGNLGNIGVYLTPASGRNKVVLHYYCILVN